MDYQRRDRSDLFGHPKESVPETIGHGAPFVPSPFDDFAAVRNRRASKFVRSGNALVIFGREKTWTGIALGNVHQDVVSAELILSLGGHRRRRLTNNDVPTSPKGRRNNLVVSFKYPQACFP